MVDWCWYFYTEPAEADPTQMMGETTPDYSLSIPPRGWITAMDGQTGAILWQYRAPAQVQSGLVPTKSGLLLGGDTLGGLFVLDAKTGALLKKIDVKGALNNGLISYAVAGEQYVAAEVGGVSLNSAGITRPLRSGGPLRVDIFALSGAAHPKIVRLDTVPQEGVSPQQQGERLYTGLCKGCHGAPTAHLGFDFPFLQRQAHILTSQSRLKDFLKTVSPPMPKLYPGVLGDNDIRLLVTYFKSQDLPPNPGYKQPSSAGAAGWPAIYSVLTDPRCLNCHTLAADPNNLDDRYPRQGDDRHPHFFGVTAGSANDTGDSGPLTERCSSCHGDSNNAFTGAPGAPGWRLAPISMAWESAPNVAMSGSRLCGVLKDQSKNGDLDLQALLKHVTSEPLVLSSFAPGVRLNGAKRATPKLTHNQFVAVFTK